MIGRWWKRIRDGVHGSDTPETDPGPSPVPWLSDEIWRSWNAGIVNPAQWEKVPGHPIGEAWPTNVTEEDRRRCRSAPVPAKVAIPAEGTLAEHAALLQSTPGTGFINLVRWPVCCDRLTTLLHESIRTLEEAVGPMDAVLTDAHHESEERWPSIKTGWDQTLAEMRIGKHGGDGIAFFQCRACGRIYGAFCQP